MNRQYLDLSSEGAKLRDFFLRIRQCFKMLYVWEIQNRQSIQDLLENLDISKQTWLLSDLRTKFEIQELFIQNRGFFLEESVLRISDLWKKILLRSYPEYKVISQQAVILHLKYFLRLHGESIGLPESSENTLLKWMTDLAPFYFHPEGEEKLRDWFSQNPEQEESWKDWWLRTKAVFSYFKSKKLLLAQWIPAFLQSVTDTPLFWEKDLVVDLSSQLSFVEAELLHQISKRQDVTILAPVLKNLVDLKKSQYSDLLRPYEYLKGFANKVEKTQSQNKFKTTKEYGNFSSTLGSLRQTTAIVRSWIEQKVPLDQIAIVAPDIEAVWPVLAFHLEAEGIPFNKNKLSSSQATVAVQLFLSRLRALNYNLSTRDLELSYYGYCNNNQKNELIFEKFEALYKNIYDEADYGRFDKMKQGLKIEIDLKSSISHVQFIFQIAKIDLGSLSQEIPNWLEVLVRDLLASFDENFLLPWSDWVSFCETCLSRHEIMVSEAVREGIMVTNIMSAHFLKVTHRIFIELSEENLKVKSDRGIMPQTARQISKDLGYWLSHSEKGDLEFELEWAIQCGIKSDHLYFGAVNLIGQIMTPSSVWLKSKNNDSENSEAHKIPHKTVLDSILNKNVQSPRLLQDLGELEYDLLENSEVKILSPSALETFQKCPFTYFARQTLGLKTFPEIDLDFDRRSAGEALHYLFEVIMKRGLSSWNEIELDLLLEQTKKTHFASVVEALWEVQKKKMLKLCQKFLQFEKKWRQEYPQIKETKTEVSWKGQFQGTEYRGRIDRIDISAQNEMVVIDYKLSGSQLKGAHNWIENGSLQMLFYIHALENGWASGIEGQVIASFYFVIKNFSRETGFELDTEIPGFFKNTKKRGQKLNFEKKKELLNTFEDRVKLLTDKIQNGEIKPLPTDEKFCTHCDWRRLCRAPHLA